MQSALRACTNWLFCFRLFQIKAKLCGWVKHNRAIIIDWQGLGVGCNHTVTLLKIVAHNIKRQLRGGGSSMACLSYAIFSRLELSITWICLYKYYHIIKIFILLSLTQWFPKKKQWKWLGLQIKHRWSPFLSKRKSLPRHIYRCAWWYVWTSDF